MRTKKMALLLLLIMLSIHLHASSQNLLVSALDQQEDQNVGDRRSQGLDVNTSMKVASVGVTVVDKRGGGGGGGGGHGGGGHGGGGHGGSSARSAGGSDGDTTGKGSNRGYAAVVPLFAAGAGAHHVNNRPAHHGKNVGTTTYIGLPFLASGVLISLFVAQPF
ncbi:glycine-rich protein DOT1-like [Rhododendron vialii]|uniref:glycine-rich protein DOT1-like n=1 Tax=Rhododendron vialii TaxID=182163 RepID=UPI00265F3BD3|nr:glycine-rich protein DOT1-like [Rhododendron vialii]